MLPGTLIVLAAAAFINGQPAATCEKQIVVISQAYPRAVLVCSFNALRDGKTGPTVQIAAPSWAAGWRVKRTLRFGAGCPPTVEGIQLLDGRLMTEHGIY